MIAKKAKIFRGPPDSVDSSGGVYSCETQDAKCEKLVINPRNLAHLSVAHGWGWYVKWCIMKELNYTMFVDWKPSFLTSDRCAELLKLSAEDRSAEMEHLECIVIPSIATPLYSECYDSLSLIPLLETLIHVNQEWFGMTLSQIACSISDGFRPEFNDEHKLMQFLFEENRLVFRELCENEITPIQDLYQCNFNVTFEHNQQNLVERPPIRSTRNLKNVVMRSLSSIVSNTGKTYGNIPWLISDPSVREKVVTKAKFILHPFGFFEETAMDEGLLFRSVCILPEVVIETEEQTEAGETTLVRQAYPAGSIMGIAIDKNGLPDTVMRGKLFEGTTTREQIILTFMFGAYVEGVLESTTNCTQLLRNLKLNEDQIPVRASFINAVQGKLLESKR